MDFSWLTPTHPLSEILIGGAGNLLGNIVEKRAGEWIGALHGRLRSRFQSPLQRDAVQQALSYALVETISLVSNDVDDFEKLLRRFDRWLESDDVIYEFSEFLLAPGQDVSPDLALLEEAFGQAGFDPQRLGEGRSFAEIVATLADKFCLAAASQPQLKGVLDTDLLRQLVGRLEQVVKTGKEQVGLLEKIEEILRSFQPLDLEEQERTWLQGFYAECNELPLARRKEDPGGRQPRLQRVYVDLLIDQTPSHQQVLDRLDIREKAKRQRALAHLKKLESAARRTQTTVPEIDNTAPLSLDDWSHEIGQLDRRALEKLAQQLEVEVATLQAVLLPLTPSEALHEHKQLLILGDPGSGKSTLTQRLTALFAAAGANDKTIHADLGEEEVAQMARLLKTLGRRLLPVRIILSQWAAHQLAANQLGCADDLIAECIRVLGKTGRLNERQEQTFRGRLHGEQPTALLLLDGLDEVSDEGKRSSVLRAVAGFRRHYPAVPLLVTCRVRPYQALSDLEKQSLPLARTLAPLHDAAIASFIQRWYDELVRVSRTPMEISEKSQQAQQRLQVALNDESRGPLRQMAGTPLLLTMMAKVNYDNPLPGSRAELYEQFVDQLLYEWERLKQDDMSRLTGLELLLDKAKIDKKFLANQLNQLAFAVHGRSQRQDTVEIPQSELETLLRDIAPGTPAQKAEWAIEVLALIADRSGLIYATDTTPNRAIYKFSHRTFQEYLAARWLTTGLSHQQLQKFQDKLGEPENWREAVLLGFGHLIMVKGDYANALNILDSCLAQAPPQDEAGWQQLLLLGEAYVRLLGLERAKKVNNPRQVQSVFDIFAAHLLLAMQQRDLPPPLRLEAGLLLASLDLDPPGLDEFIAVPQTNIRIGKYPVTNKQFRRFYDAKGYEQRKWWSEEGWKYKEEYQWTEPSYWDTPRFSYNTQPVMAVSWYEAEAYCNWLSQQGRHGLQASEVARLPTQQEWMLAARNGALEALAENCDYPWQSEFEMWRANTKESKLKQTAPVHMHPGGVSAGGVWDLSGNVWEWTSDGEKDKDGDWFYYLKGGNWSSEPERCLAGARFWFDAWIYWYYRGFRVCAVPISH